MLTPHKAQPSRQAKTTGCYIPLKEISSLKRNHIQRLDVAQEGSPSKWIRFHDKSVFSSNRTDDPGCGQEAALQDKECMTITGSITGAVLQEQ